MISDELLSILLNKATSDTPTKLEPLLDELISIYMNDPNSSTLRELITLTVAGYESVPGKLGRDAIDPKTGKEKEVKPKNFTGKPTNGSGCFNDYTRERFERDKEYGLEIVHSLFVSGKLVYVVEFDFSAISEKLEKQIIEKCEVKKNDYVRSASWTYKEWITHPSLRIHYLNSELLQSGKFVNRHILNTFKSVQSVNGTVLRPTSDKNVILSFGKNFVNYNVNIFTKFFGNK